MNLSIIELTALGRWFMVTSEGVTSNYLGNKMAK